MKATTSTLDARDLTVCKVFLWQLVGPALLHCGGAIYSVCHYFIQTAPSALASVDDRPSQTAKQTSTGCSAETVGAQSTHARMKRIHPRVKTSRENVCKEKHISCDYCHDSFKDKRGCF